MQRSGVLHAVKAPLHRLAIAPLEAAARALEQMREIGGGQSDSAEELRTSDVQAVEVGPARNRESVLGRNCQVTRSRLLVVRAVIGLHGRKANGHELGDELVSIQRTWMRQRCNSPRLNDGADNLNRRRAAMGNIRRLPLAQKPIERLGHGSDMPASDERPRDRRPRDRAARCGGAVHQLTDVNRRAFSRQSMNDFARPLQTRGPKRVQERGESRGVAIDPVPENVDIVPVAHGGDLDARDEPKLEPSRVRRRLRHGIHGVVIGDGEHRDTRVPRPRDEFSRRALAVGAARTARDRARAVVCRCRSIMVPGPMTTTSACCQFR